MDIINVSETAQLVNLLVMSVVVSLVINDIKTFIKTLLFSKLRGKSKIYYAAMPLLAIAIAYVFTYNFNTNIFLGKISILDRLLVASIVSKGGNGARVIILRIVKAFNFNPMNQTKDNRKDDTNGGN